MQEYQVVLRSCGSITSLVLIRLPERYVQTQRPDLTLGEMMHHGHMYVPLTFWFNRNSQLAWPGACYIAQPGESAESRLENFGKVLRYRF